MITLLISLISVAQDIPIDKKYHFTGGYIIGGIAYGITYDFTGGDKIASAGTAIISTLIAGALWEHFHADREVAFPGNYIDFNDMYTGTLGAAFAVLTVGGTIEIINGSKKRKKRNKELNKITALWMN